MSRQPFGKPSARQASTPPGPGERAASTSRPPMARSRSGSPGIFSLVGLAQPNLTITLSEDILFLHPTPKDFPAEDPVLQGTVTLYLPKKRSLNHLTVRLVGRQDISWGDSRPYESGICLDKEVALFSGKDEVVLDKGEHQFSFSIIVPSSTPTCERCQWGRVRHTVVAKAKGLGQLGGDVLSTEKPLFLIVNPGGSGASEPPPLLDHRFEGMLNDLGPYTMALQSQHVMVGGLLLFRFHLVSPPLNVMIYSIKIKINQHFTIISPTDSNRLATPPADVRTIIHLDGNHPPNFGTVADSTPVDRTASQARIGPLKMIAPEEEYKIHHLARLPDDSNLRPSTHELTESAIRVKHDIAMEVTYRVVTPEEAADLAKGGSPKPREGKGKEKEKEKEREKVPDRKKLVVSKGLEVFSCCCFVDSLTLPAYSFNDPALDIDEADKAPPCLCGFKMGQVIKFHGQELLREEGEGGITYAPLLKSDPPTPTDSTGRGRTPGRNLSGFFRTESSDSLSAPIISPPLRSPTSRSPSTASTLRTSYF
ncbi:hypothetical protein BCR35DRAFT_298406 [Leucosporidium creatinivorum]|uniref:Arrestin-like N-terminal domain-containing protein n=1 Tax=Leucosporidium creatinivorum TaxID=106004 RepID=A0A1Y2G8G0_9BASI|nr:hypothetical protein BCR35DRAFT_298406 [Leucosporidium creatinivorum]